MKKSVLKKCGEAAFGDKWQTELAVALGRHFQTINRWRRDAKPIPDTVALELKEVMAKRKEKLERAMAALDKEIERIGSQAA